MIEKGRQRLREAETKLNEYFKEKLKKDHDDPDENKPEADEKKQEADSTVPTVGPRSRHDSCGDRPSVPKQLVE